MHINLWESGQIFSEREVRLIKNCRRYVDGDPAGLPGHNLMVIIDKMDYALRVAVGTMDQEQVSDVLNTTRERYGMEKD